MPDSLSIAREAAQAGGAVLRAREASVGPFRHKSSLSDLVTEVDIASGVSVVRSILDRLPHARFVVEESEVYGLAGVEEGSLDDPEVWVIDPLDGTTSYVHGFPCYSVSVALLREGVPHVGAVYNIPADEMNTAERGKGAERNGHFLAASDVDTIEKSLLMTGFPYDRTVTLDRQLAVLTRMLRTVHGIRRDGSAAIDCTHVAAGAADGFWEFALKPWDTAAGALIASEAGAKVTDMSGRPWTTETCDIVIAGPALHPRILEVIESALEEAGFETPPSA